MNKFDTLRILSIVLIISCFFIFEKRFSTTSFLSANDYHHRELSLRGTRVHRNHSNPGIYILPIPDDPILEVPWSDIKMPSKSFFSGFNPPNDTAKWKIALLQASRGEQILLGKALNEIRSPLELCPGDTTYKWIHRIADIMVSTEASDGGLNALKSFRGHRVPIALLGYRRFSHGNFEGSSPGFVGFGPNQVLNSMQFVIPRKFIGIGNMDENWGWLSTYFLNRYVGYAF